MIFKAKLNFSSVFNFLLIVCFGVLYFIQSKKNIRHSVSHSISYIVANNLNIL